MRAFVTSLLLAGSILSPGVAIAAAPSTQSGVHIDPGSPAGKQYAIPIAAARSVGAGGPGSSAGSGTDPPLFGTGVTPSSGRSSDPSSAKATGARPRRRAAKPQHVGVAPPQAVATPQASPSIASARTSGAGGSSGWLALAGGGALVLVVGGAGGLALRRRSGGSTPAL